jgi:succinoglycan biosynthesis protein ExoM
MTQVATHAPALDVTDVGPPLIAIAICTHRRPERLAGTLDGISLLSFPPASAPSLQVVVVDNEGDPRVHAVVDAFAARTGIRTSFVVEPRRGISQARNAALDLVPANADFVAFIDDDETPSPEWLRALLATQARTGAAVVCGPVLPEFETEPPAWIVEGRFFAHPRKPDAAIQGLLDGAEIDDARTGNVLLSVRLLRESGARFDDAFGLTGGEDALFFRVLSRRGAKMVWSPEARVHEHVPVARACFAYLAREYFRCGNVRAAIDALDARGTAAPLARLRAAPFAAKKALRKAAVHAGLLMAAAIGLRGRARICAHALELANAAGRLSYLCGMRYEHYR